MSPRTLAALAMATFVAMAGCGGDDGDGGLTVLRKEKLATVSVPGTGRGDTLEQRGGHGLIKPTHAALLRQLPILSGSDPQAVHAEAVRIATGDGWTVNSGPAPTPDHAILLRKTVDGTNLQAGISLGETSGGPVLRINLTNLT
jgi:hypothetical protein